MESAFEGEEASELEDTSEDLQDATVDEAAEGNLSVDQIDAAMRAADKNRKKKSWIYEEDSGVFSEVADYIEDEQYLIEQEKNVSSRRFRKDFPRESKTSTPIFPKTLSVWPTASTRFLSTAPSPMEETAPTSVSPIPRIPLKVRV